MATKLEIYNGALAHLGPTRLLSLTEDRFDRRELDAVYAPSLTYMLEQASWRFALRTVQLEADGDIDPAFGARTYGYTLPDDFVRFAGLSPNEDFASDLMDYQLDGGVLYSTVSTIWLRYVSKDDALGLDPGRYSPTFAEALEAWMAHKAAMPILKDRTVRDVCLRDHLRLLSRAKDLEAIKDPVKPKPSGSWGRSRGIGGINPYFRGGRVGWRG